MEIKFVVHTGDIVMDNIDDEKSVGQGLDLLKNIRVPVHLKQKQNPCHSLFWPPAFLEHARR
jgi:hypothetical protein